MKMLLAIMISHVMNVTAAATGLIGRYDGRTVPQGHGTTENILTQSTFSEFRCFLWKNGKTIRGRVLAYNPDKSTVTIAEENGKTCRADLNTFSTDDQGYVREWHFINEFFTKLDGRISTMEKRNGDGAEFLIWHPDKEIVYDITFENRSSCPLNDLTVGYCIYYELNRPGNRGRVMSQDVKCGSLDIGSLAGGAEIQIKTHPLFLPRGDLYEYYKDHKVPIGKVQGIWIRIYLPLDNGKKVLRELAVPNSIMKTRNWASPNAPEHPPDF